MPYKLPIGQPFDLELTLRCGQGHRWLPDVKKPGWYDSVLDGDFVSICQDDGGIAFDTTADDEYMDYKLRRQFRLDDNIQVIYVDLSNRDSTMAGLVREYDGLRVMRVDPWECSVFFILSRQNTVNVTHRDMETISKRGVAKKPGDGARSPFPAPQKIAQAGPTGIPRRPREIFEAAQSVADLSISLDALKAAEYEQVEMKLQALRGVGDKICNCVALFSLEKLYAFPVDTNIYDSLEALYPGEPVIAQTNRQRIKEGNQSAIRKVRWWAQDKFGSHAGYASQFLFIWNLKGQPQLPPPPILAS